MHAYCCLRLTAYPSDIDPHEYIYIFWTYTKMKLPDFKNLHLVHDSTVYLPDNLHDHCSLYKFKLATVSINGNSLSLH